MDTCSIDWGRASTKPEIWCNHMSTFHLDYPCCIEGVCRGGDPARQEGSVSLHQEDGEACDGLAPGLALTTSEFAVKWVDSSPECRCSQY